MPEIRGSKMIDFYKKLAQQQATAQLQIKLQPVIKEWLKSQPGGMSQYVLNLIVADYERQTAVKDGE